MTSIRCKLPNLIIAGVHKAGSTSLYTYLAKHPQICASFTKEIDFFTPLMSNNDISEISIYGKHFEHCGDETFRMEASPSYFYGKGTIAKAIKRELTDVRIIVILRDPADRLVSLFSRAVSNSQIPDDVDFQDYVAISERKQNSDERDVYSMGIREGIYINYICPWQSVFGHDLKVVFFDDLSNDAFGLTVSICEWLGLDAGCFKPQDFVVENKTLHYRFRTLHRYTRDQYMKNEVFWRRHHRLKQRVRSVYNLLNAGAERKLRTVDEAELSRLQGIFAPHNQALKAFLESNNYKSLPAWLK